MFMVHRLSFIGKKPFSDKIRSVYSHSCALRSGRVYFSGRRRQWLFKLNVAVRPSTSASSNNPIAVAAPWRGVRIKGRKKMSVSGSNHWSIRMILVDTMPGSAALTVIPRARRRSASSMVKSWNQMPGVGERNGKWKDRGMADRPCFTGFGEGFCRPDVTAKDSCRFVDE